MTRMRALIAFALAIGLCLGLGIRSSRADGGSVTFDGFTWEPLGQAVLTVTANGLEVSNIGSSGQDGVRQVVPANYVPGSPNPFHRVVDGGLKNSGVPAGAFMRWQKRGTLAGVPNQLRETFTAEHVLAGRVTFAVDMSPLSPSSLTANYYLDGDLVGSETGLPASAITDGCDRMPDDYGDGFTWVFSLTGEPIRGFQPGAIITDEVVVVPVGSTVSVGDLSSIDWTAADVEDFTIRALE
jgi:hypothetical protein